MIVKPFKDIKEDYLKVKEDYLMVSILLQDLKYHLNMKRL